ncbi:MAG: methionyl-tRNA formyltransferase [Actinomycetota bacterium]|jgi:methionyl-tRNA formyltransferase
MLANNRLGHRVARLLAERGDLAGLVLHPLDRRTAAADLEAIDVPTWTWPDGLDEIRGLAPECLLSVLFGFIVPDDWLAVPSWSAVNLHPAYLPWNRGSAPNVWPLVDGSPAGTTLHVMTAGLDRGPVLLQRQVEVRPDDTAATLYRRLEDASFDMMVGEWEGLRDVEPHPQEGEGTYHRLADLQGLDLATDEDLAVLDRLRARTYPPHGAEFERDGLTYRVRVEIERLP